MTNQFNKIALASIAVVMVTTVADAGLFQACKPKTIIQNNCVGSGSCSKWTEPYNYCGYNQFQSCTLNPGTTSTVSVDTVACATAACPGAGYVFSHTKVVTDGCL